MSLNPLRRISMTIAQWRRRPRQLETKFAMLSGVTKGVLLLSFPLYLTPSEYGKNPRLRRLFSWLSLGLVAIYTFKAGILFFYKSGGYDLPARVPDIVPGIDGAVFFHVALCVFMAVVLAGTATSQWLGDHFARLGHAAFGWDEVRPARFGFYLVHSLGAWVWMAVALATLGLSMLPVLQPMWTASNLSSPLAVTCVLGGGAATILIAFRRRTVQERIALEIYGSAASARRATLLFHLLPTLVVFALLLVLTRFLS